MSELGLHKSGTNTNDATATASDILNEKTAYVKGVKVIGTQSLASLTADATATAADISNGATAYVKGAKVTGALSAFSTPIQAPTVFPTDPSGNFGLFPPYDCRMMPGSFLFYSAADVGAIPSNIMAGKSVLGVAGNGVSPYSVATIRTKTQQVDTSQVTNPKLVPMSGNHIKRVKIHARLNTNYTPQPYTFDENGLTTIDFYLNKDESKTLYMTQAGVSYWVFLSYDSANNQLVSYTSVDMGGYGGNNGVYFDITEEAFCLI